MGSIREAADFVPLECARRNVHGGSFSVSRLTVTRGMHVQGVFRRALYLPSTW